MMMMMTMRILTTHQREVEDDEDDEGRIEDSQADQEPTSGCFKNFLIRRKHAESALRMIGYEACSPVEEVCCHL